MQKPIRRAVLRRGFVDGYQLVQLHLDCGHYVDAGADLPKTARCTQCELAQASKLMDSCIQAERALSEYPKALMLLGGFTKQARAGRLSEEILRSFFLGLNAGGALSDEDLSRLDANLQRDDQRP